MQKLEKVDASFVKVIRFYPNVWKNFSIRAKNLSKIVLIITEHFNKNIFEAGELEEIYNYVIKNYKSNLTRREYDKIRSTIKDFIDVWGKIEIIKKD